MFRNQPVSLRGRKVAILSADGVVESHISVVKKALEAEGILCDVIAPRLGFISAGTDVSIPVNKSFLTTASVFYDGVYVAGGTSAVAAIEAEPDAIHFLNEAFKHCKPIVLHAEAEQVLLATYFGRKIPNARSQEMMMQDGLIVTTENSAGEMLAAAMMKHRFWEREKARKIPA